ncbi:MAG: Na(+)-translocating NADH-quinone reductase subunit A [Bacteriovoracia bacterium]
MLKIGKGLDLPIIGKPRQSITETKIPKHMAFLGKDYIGLRPTFHIKEGEKVEQGTHLFSDKKNPGVKFISPVTGEVMAINRGAKRVFESLVIRIDKEKTLHRKELFEKYNYEQIKNLDKEKVRNLMTDSGIWTALRTRPFSKIPKIDKEPHSIFVTAIDTNPLSLDPKIVISEHHNVLRMGLISLSKLTKGRIFLCKGPGTDISVDDFDFVQTEVFDGAHPAGNVGTHIHFLDPVGEEKEVWHIGFQDVIALGYLLLEGKIDFQRVLAIGGPEAQNPRLIRTILGASTKDILEDEFNKNKLVRVISGSVFNGHHACGHFAYTGRYQQQISLIAEDTDKEFLGWMKPGKDKFSIKPAFISKMIPNKKFAFTTNLNGSPRAIVPIGAYEKVMPLDIQPTMLLKSLYTSDLEASIELGCLELDEEDLSLCTFVCPSKLDHGKKLREKLNIIEKEG